MARASEPRLVGPAGRRGLALALASAATFGLTELIGLNNWLIRYTQKGWNVPLYPRIFPLALLLFVLALLLWRKRRRLPVFLLVPLGCVAGHLAGIASYQAASLMSPYGVDSFRNGLDLMGFWGFLAFLAIGPAVLLGWVYGGLLAGANELFWWLLRPRSTRARRRTSPELP